MAKTFITRRESKPISNMKTIFQKRRLYKGVLQSKKWENFSKTSCLTKSRSKFYSELVLKLRKKSFLLKFKNSVLVNLRKTKASQSNSPINYSNTQSMRIFDYLFKKHFCNLNNLLHHFSPTGIFPLATCFPFPSFFTSTAFSVAHISTWAWEERYGPIRPWAL